MPLRLWAFYIFLPFSNIKYNTKKSLCETSNSKYFPPNDSEGDTLFFFSFLLCLLATATWKIGVGCSACLVKSSRLYYDLITLFGPHHLWVEDNSAGPSLALVRKCLNAGNILPDKSVLVCLKLLVYALIHLISGEAEGE